jgi:hypothetical protein
MSLTRRSVTRSRSAATWAMVRPSNAGFTHARPVARYPLRVDSVTACRSIHASTAVPKSARPPRGSTKLAPSARWSWVIFSRASLALRSPLPYLTRPCASISSLKDCSRCLLFAKYRSVHACGHRCGRSHVCWQVPAVHALFVPGLWNLRSLLQDDARAVHVHAP